MENSLLVLRGEEYWGWVDEMGGAGQLYGDG